MYLKNKNLNLFLIICFIIIIIRYLIWKNNQYVYLSDLLSISISAAESGGKLVKLVRNDNNLNKKSKGKTKEGMNDPVTNGDLYSHNAIIKTLIYYIPKIKIVSEEKHFFKIKYIPNKLQTINIVNNKKIDVKDLLIWVDPLDATQEYTENLLNYVTTMICVVYKGEPLIGVIHQPFKNITYWSINDTISPNLRNKPYTFKSSNIIKILVSRSHSGEIEQLAHRIILNNYTISQAGGAGYKVIEVAKGNADIYLHGTYIKKWDICAGNAILNAIGGQITDLSGLPISYGDPNDHVLKYGLIAVRNKNVLSDVRFKN